MLWRDGKEKNPGGNPSQTADGLLQSKIKATDDFGLDRGTIRRYCKRLKIPEKFDDALQAVQERCVKVCKA